MESYVIAGTCIYSFSLTQVVFVLRSIRSSMAPHLNVLDIHEYVTKVFLPVLREISLIPFLPSSQIDIAVLYI